MPKTNQSENTEETKVVANFSDDKATNKSPTPNPKACLEAARIAIEQKGLDVRAIQVSECSSIADYFLIVSATSERHAKGIADKILKTLREELEEKATSTNGYDSGEWILIDYADLLVHIFYEPIRQYYEFDELWKNADEVKLSAELEEQARKLRTGVIPTSY